VLQLLLEEWAEDERFLGTDVLPQWAKGSRIFIGTSGLEVAIDGTD